MTQATSVRLEQCVYESAKAIARRRGITMNKLIDNAIRQEIIRAEEHEMYEAATLLGQDAESSVDFAFAAQAEVARKD